MRPLISVVIPTYRPGDGIDRVVASLDAQTLPATDFEVIIVDDGSPDDTYERLLAFAATRPNYRVERIENSGWPSRPRNVATRMARGDYVFYMDHDDSLFVDGLRRAHEYAARTGVDLLNVKETKTSDAWWCMPALAEGNADDVKHHQRIDRMLPMVPHKLYRREFLLANDISFPEGRRMLWEDVYFNIEAYAKADRVGILADTPVYLWHASGSNNSKSYGPRDVEFWDRMDDLMAFIDRTLQAPELAREHRSALMHQYRSRILRRLGKALGAATPDQRRMAVSRARALQDRFIPLEWDALADAWEYPRAACLRAGRADLLQALHSAYGAFSGRTRTESVEWVDEGLQLSVQSSWFRAGAPLPFERQGDRLVLPLPAEFGEVLPDPSVDVSGILDKFQLVVGARARDVPVMWQLPLTRDLVGRDLGDGTVGLTLRGRARFDLNTLALGRPAAADVWDFLAVTRWAGLARTGGLKTTTPALAALLRGRPAVAYTSQKGNLALDLCQRLRSVAADGQPTLGPVHATASGFRIELPTVTVVGDSRIPIEVRLSPLATADAGQLHTLPGTLIGSDGKARLEVTGQPSQGTHRVDFVSAEGSLVKGRLQLTATGDVAELSAAPIDPVPKTGSHQSSPLGRAWARCRRVLSGAARRVGRRG